MMKHHPMLFHNIELQIPSRLKYYSSVMCQVLHDERNGFILSLVYKLNMMG